MPDYNYYCSNCLYRVKEEVDDYEEEHQREFHCDQICEEEFDEEKLFGKGWIYDIFDQLEMAEELLFIDAKEVKDGWFSTFSARFEPDEYLYGRRPRIAYILIDNALELILFGRIFFSDLKDKIDKLDRKTRNKVQTNIHKKIEILENEKIINPNQSDLIKFFHQIRNKFYHNIIFDNVFFIKLANTYIVLCRDLLKDINEIIYPLKNYKGDILKFDEKEIIDYLFLILKNYIDELKYNISKSKEIYDNDQNISNRYKTPRDLIVRDLNFYFAKYDNNGNLIVPNKYDSNELALLINSKNLLKKRDIDTAEKIQGVIGDILKNISEIIQINHILDSWIDSYYYAQEIMEDSYYDR
jgi:hypothetical protein